MENMSTEEQKEAEKKQGIAELIDLSETMDKEREIESANPKNVTDGSTQAPAAIEEPEEPEKPIEKIELEEYEGAYQDIISTIITEQAASVSAERINNTNSIMPSEKIPSETRSEGKHMHVTVGEMEIFVDIDTNKTPMQIVDIDTNETPISAEINTPKDAKPAQSMSLFRRVSSIFRKQSKTDPKAICLVGTDSEKEKLLPNSTGEPEKRKEYTAISMGPNTEPKDSSISVQPQTEGDLNKPAQSDGELKTLPEWDWKLTKSATVLTLLTPVCGVVGLLYTIHAYTDFKTADYEAATKKKSMAKKVLLVGVVFYIFILILMMIKAAMELKDESRQNAANITSLLTSVEPTTMKPTNLPAFYDFNGKPIYRGVKGY